MWWQGLSRQSRTWAMQMAQSRSTSAGKMAAKAQNHTQGLIIHMPLMRMAQRQQPVFIYICGTIIPRSLSQTSNKQNPTGWTCSPWECLKTPNHRKRSTSTGPDAEGSAAAACVYLHLWYQLTCSYRYTPRPLFFKSATNKIILGLDSLWERLKDLEFGKPLAKSPWKPQITENVGRQDGCETPKSQKTMDHPHALTQMAPWQQATSVWRNSTAVITSWPGGTTKLSGLFSKSATLQILQGSYRPWECLKVELSKPPFQAFSSKSLKNPRSQKAIIIHMHWHRRLSSSNLCLHLWYQLTSRRYYTQALFPNEQQTESYRVRTVLESAWKPQLTFCWMMLKFFQGSSCTNYPSPRTVGCSLFEALW